MRVSRLSEVKKNQIIAYSERLLWHLKKFQRICHVAALDVDFNSSDNPMKHEAFDEIKMAAGLAFIMNKILRQDVRGIARFSFVDYVENFRYDFEDGCKLVIQDASCVYSNLFSTRECC